MFVASLSCELYQEIRLYFKVFIQPTSWRIFTTCMAASSASGLKATGISSTSPDPELDKQKKYRWMDGRKRQVSQEGLKVNLKATDKRLIENKQTKNREPV